MKATFAVLIFLLVGASSEASSSQRYDRYEGQSAVAISIQELSIGAPKDIVRCAAFCQSLRNCDGFVTKKSEENQESNACFLLEAVTEILFNQENSTLFIKPSIDI